MKWNFDLTQMPNETPVLFFLSGKMLGSRIHAGRRSKCANGYLITVGCYFACDAPDILAWRPMVKNPKEEIKT